MKRLWILASVVVLSVAAVTIIYAARHEDDPTARVGAVRIPQPTAAHLAAAGLDKVPVAPDAKRVDLVLPRFSHPTRITNPLFPISSLASVVFDGKVEGKPFHTETTLLPYTRIIEWPKGNRVETLVSQYTAYEDGRIIEVAIDHYAQADDGSVWYWGEDVQDYRDGLIFTREGTWIAGKDGPPAMIMPGHPKVGDVFRPENIPGVVFEEVEVTSVDRTVDGPTGPIANALVARELHDDGSYSDKIFAPGYGEFYSAHRDEIEPLALAVPANAVPGAEPAALGAMGSAADRAFDQIRSKDWPAASKTLTALNGTWTSLKSGQPPLLVREMDRALRVLDAGIAARDQARASTGAIDVARGAGDIALRYRPPTAIDRLRFDLMSRQLLVDATSGNAGGVASDYATLEWVRDRFAHSLDAVDVTAIDASLLELGSFVADENLHAAITETSHLRKVLAGARSLR